MKRWCTLFIRLIFYIYYSQVCDVQWCDQQSKQAGAELYQAQLRFEVWGLVKALSLTFENGNVKEVWSQRSFKLRKLLDENFEVEEVLADEVWSWRSFKVMKFEI